MANPTLFHITLVALIGLLTLHSGCEQPKSSTQEDAVKVQDDAVAEKGSSDSKSDAGPIALPEVEEAPQTTTPAPTPMLEGPADVDQGSGEVDQDLGDTGSFDDEWTDDMHEAKLEAERKKRALPTIKIGDNWTRLSKEREVWIDKKSKHVMFAGHICLTAGQLEMFICPEGTKEHESVISSSALASEIHMALLLFDCKPGKASSWNPVYRPAHGPTIDATVTWRDEKSGKTKSTDAKQWIRDVDTQKAMAQRWIFGGSEFWTDPDTGEEVYYGDSGELICLSNFSTATIDVDVKSSQANDGLLFEAFTENIPPVGTKVYTILKPGEIVKPEKIEEAKPSQDDEAKQVETKSTDAQSVDSPAEKPAEVESVDARAGSGTKEK